MHWSYCSLALSLRNNVPVSVFGNFLFQEEVKEEDDSDFKSSHKFADHMDKNEAVSDFAKKKTLNQQREYLPVFAVRQEVRISASVCCEARGKNICQYLLWGKK